MNCIGFHQHNFLHRYTACYTFTICFGHHQHCTFTAGLTVPSLYWPMFTFHVLCYGLFLRWHALPLYTSFIKILKCSVCCHSTVKSLLIIKCLQFVLINIDLFWLILSCLYTCSMSFPLVVWLYLLCCGAGWSHMCTGCDLILVSILSWEIIVLTTSKWLVSTEEYSPMEQNNQKELH
jgi:hypothetical protein